MAYRYSRERKKLAIGLGGGSDPMLLVDGKHVFIWLWNNEDKTSTYLEFKKSHAIGWSDIDEAMRLIEQQCPLVGIPFYLPGPLLPYLDGGVEQLFSKKTQILKRDDRDAELIFIYGHTDGKVLKTSNVSNLDPQKFPRCIKTEDAVSAWKYAFHHETGLISAATGVVPRMQVVGTPGEKVQVFLQQVVTYHAGEESREFPEVSLRLPKAATTIVIDDLKSALHKEMLRGGLKRMIDEHAEIDKELQAIIETEKKLTRKIVEQQANPARNPKELKQLQLELESTQGTRKTYTYVEAATRRLIDEIRQKQKNAHPE